MDPVNFKLSVRFSVVFFIYLFYIGNSSAKDYTILGVMDGNENVMEQG